MIELCSDYVVRKSSESLSLKHLELLVTYEMFWLILGYTGYTHTKTLQVPHAPQKCSTVAQLVRLILPPLSVCKASWDG